MLQRRSGGSENICSRMIGLRRPLLLFSFRDLQRLVLFSFVNTSQTFQRVRELAGLIMPMHVVRRLLHDEGEQGAGA
jgi:hypothetical protein